MTEFSPVTSSEVMSLIKRSAPKTCCLDPIPTPLLVNNVESVIDIITEIMNESLVSGVVPLSFRQAVITPILKKSSLSSDELKNFRPVSNLPFLSKILEKLVLIQLNKHLDKNGLYELNQSAYRKFHNTETSLLRVYSDLLCEADQNKVSILTLLDLSAAFDTIDHGYLIERLSRTFGISGMALNWFISYLSNRSQAVIIQGVRSTEHNLEQGVPQGSVLGPTLYTMYTQPLGRLLRSHYVNFQMYADDIQLYKSVSPNEVTLLLTQIENCLNDVGKWMIVNKLKMNQEKTEVLLIDPKNKCETTIDYINIDGDRVKLSSHARNLGVMFNDKLSNDTHFNTISKTLYCEIRKIGQLTQFLDRYSLKTLMCSFVLTRIDYCNSLFVNSSDESLNKLQRFQNTAAKIILGKKKNDHVSPLFRDLHWLPIRSRIVYKISLLVFKCINLRAPAYLQELVQMYIPSRALRSQSQFLLKVPKTGSVRLSGRSFYHSAPQIWNSLPQRIRTIDTEAEFKTAMKTYLFDDLISTII